MLSTQVSGLCANTLPYLTLECIWEESMVAGTGLCAVQSWTIFGSAELLQGGYLVPPFFSLIHVLVIVFDGSLTKSFPSSCSWEVLWEIISVVGLEQKALQIHPNCPASVRLGMGLCRYRLGQFKKASQALERVLQVSFPLVSYSIWLLQFPISLYFDRFSPRHNSK